MKIIFVRHGDPDYVNDTLTKEGIIEAKLLNKRIKELNADEFYTSPLGRAKDTAAIALEGTGKEAKVLDFMAEFPALVEDAAYNGGRIWDILPEYLTSDERYFLEKEWYDTDLMKTGPVKETYNKLCGEFDDFIKKARLCKKRQNLRGGDP